MKANVRKDVVSANEVKTEPAKAEPAKAAAPAAEKKPAAKKTAEKKPAAKKPAAKKPAAKKAAAPKKAAATESVMVEYGDRQVAVADMLANAKAAYVADGHKAADIKDIKLYVKPEENAVYYVVNDEAAGHIAF